MMGLLQVLSSAVITAAIFIATSSAAALQLISFTTLTTRDFNVSYAAVPCKDTTDPSATACMWYEMDWMKLDKIACISLAVQAETELDYGSFAPLHFACTGDDHGSTFVEFKPLTDGESCPKRARDEANGFSGYIDPVCLSGRTDGEDFKLQKREIEPPAPFATQPEARRRVAQSAIEHPILLRL